MHFRVFSEGRGTEWRICLGLLKFQTFIEIEIHDFWV